MSKQRLCINAFDKTGGWNLNDYSPQKGHEICFHTNFATCTIEKIAWTFSDEPDVVVTDLNPCHIFTKEDESGERIPGEGHVTVKAFVTTTDGECYCSYRKLLIVPVIDCQLVFEDYHIGCDTKCITIIGSGLCAELTIGNPFPDDSVQGYACGGACTDTCPNYEVVMGPLIGNNIWTYGRHCITACVGIKSKLSANKDCSPLYANNFLGKHAKYPPVERCFCIEPRNLSMQVFGGDRWFKKFIICNFSQHMLPEDGSVSWRIYNEKGKTYWKEINRCKTLCYEFRCLDYYCIEATIRYSKCCETKIVKVYLKLVDYCSDEFDIVVQPEIDVQPGGIF